MPRFEVQEINRKFHPIQVLFYIIGIALPIYSSFLILSYPLNLGITIIFVISIVFLIYTIGRIYSEVTLHRDFVELTTNEISFRSTPALGMGWLPISKSFKLKEITKVDIVKVTPSYAPSNEFTALELVMDDFEEYVIGNNLSDNQIMKIGLALKPTVRLSRSLERLLGDVEKGEYGEQMKELVNMGKSLWKSLTSDKTGSDNEMEDK